MPYAPDHIPLNKPDAFGTYPIEYAMGEDDPDMVKLVIESGANPNIDLGEGRTPLHEAVDYCIDGMIQNNRDDFYPESLEIVKILLANGGDLNKKDNRGRKPLDLINIYSANYKESFDKIVNMFRPAIPNIDELIEFTGEN
ncbi:MULTISPECIES: ankyrin repeat domain-containing protein [Niastella]|uniref:Ankyrin repeat domain-containing protein n=1 Tax=Niastella soli TaxID=2821487 RepID=A0ABS3YRQ6_9BACT|nr:ankyrin repeat domain-containing protein [Niastella soli]MBO9200597.1 ankyrin repeat domain-containing protein [Niastella soli]